MAEEKAKWKEPCGCVVTHTNIIKMCPKCDKEFKEIHNRWTEDYKRTKTD
jgi:hypothetical protein